MDDKQLNEPGKANQSRRAFARKALIGGATIATLGSRPSWGTGGGSWDLVGPCVSNATWHSYMNSGVHASASPALHDAKNLDDLAVGHSKKIKMSDDGDYCLYEKD